MQYLRQAAGISKEIPTLQNLPQRDGVERRDSGGYKGELGITAGGGNVKCQMTNDKNPTHQKIIR